MPAYATTGAGIYGITSAKGLALSSACGEGGVAPNGECINYNYSLFKGLTYGIKALSTAGIGLNFDRLVFDNNLRAAYISGATAPVITRCRFNVAPSLSAADTTRGLYLDHCTGYQVTENSFTFTGSNNARTVGTYIKHSGTLYNRLYKNEYSNLKYGVIAEGNNRNADGSTGLCIKCNDFVKCGTDISVVICSNCSLLNTTGIAIKQGLKNPIGTPPEEISDTLAAGNSYSNENHAWDIVNFNTEQNKIDYVYHGINSTQKRIAPQTVYLSGIVNVDFDALARYSSESCPGTLNGSGNNSTETDKAEQAEAETKADSITNLLNQLVDGGSTESLTETVLTALPNEALEIRDALLAESPYLSDSAMKSAVYKEDVLPNAMIRDVLVANPQSAKSEELLDAVDNRVVPMPDEMMTEIMQNLAVTGAKEALENQQAYWQMKQGELFNRVAGAYLHDTIHTWAADSLMAYCGRIQHPEVRYRLAAMLLQKGNAAACQQMINNFPAEWLQTPEAAEQHQLWADYFDLMTEPGIEHPDSLQKARLQTLAGYGSELPGVYAINYLVSLGLAELADSIVFPEPELKSAKIRHLSPSGSKKTLENSFSLFPNPASDYVIVSYANAPAQAVLTVKDATGRALLTFLLHRSTDQVTLPLTNLAPGTYLMVLTAGNKTLGSQKFTITR